MVTNIIFSADKVIKGLNRLENFSYLSEDVLLNFGEWLSPVFDGGDVDYYDVRVAAGTNNIQKLTVTESSLGGITIFDSLSSHVTVDASGNAENVIPHDGSAVVDGAYELILTSPFAGSKRFGGWSTVTGAAVDRAFKNFHSGSLGLHIQQQLEALVSGETPGDATQEYFATHNGDVDNPIITINPASILTGMDLSSVSVVRTGYTSDAAPCSLITPRHLIYAHHTGMSVGDKIVFRTTGGSFVTAIVLDFEEILGGDTGQVKLDIGIAYLDADVTGITIVKTLQKGYEEIYAPALLLGVVGDATKNISMMPLIGKIKHKADTSSAPLGWIQILANNANLFNGEGAYTFQFQLMQEIGNLIPWTNFITPVIPGDSGSAFHYVINGELVLGCHVQAVTGSHNISQYTDEINTIMNDQAGVAQGTYALQHPDLSEFNTYN